MFLRYEFFLLSSKGIFKFPKFTLRYSRSFFHLSILWWVLHRFPWKGCLQTTFCTGKQGDQSHECQIFGLFPWKYVGDKSLLPRRKVCQLFDPPPSLPAAAIHVNVNICRPRDVWMDVQRWNLSIRLWSAMCHAYPENHFRFSGSTLLWGMVSWKWLTQSWNGEIPSHFNVKKISQPISTSLKGAFLDKLPDSLASFG